MQRPRYGELKAVMEQIPDIQLDSLEQFDSKLLNPTLQKVADKRRKDHFKRLISGCIGVSDILEEYFTAVCWSDGVAGLPPLINHPPSQPEGCCSMFLVFVLSASLHPGGPEQPLQQWPLTERQQMGTLHKGARGNSVKMVEAAGWALDFCEDGGDRAFDIELEAGELVF